ncbi:GNAT family N-acetyltransferase [candidate division KSB1 bacterium]|nr:GNAT family N-acetyltransferase [candidate division KSB1 bacterium]
MPILRHYKIGDESSVFALIKDVLGEYGLQTNPEATDKDLFDIENYYIQRKGVFKVFEENKQIIGSYGIYQLSDTICELRKMYLNKTFRGQGLGKLLLADAFIEGRKLGYREMVLETNRVPKEAIWLYQKYGFEFFQPDHLSDRCDVAMKRSL